MARYIFGENKDQLFYIKKDSDGWTSTLDNFPVNNFTEDTSRNIVVGKLYEQFQNDLDLYSLNLNEALSPEDLKDFLKSKLGCLSDNSTVEVETLLDDSGEKLSKDAQKALEAIVAGKKTERTLKTKYLSKAWRTAKGTNKAIRNLASKQPVYLFAYLQSGKIIEGASQLKVYNINLKGLTEEDIHKRFESAIKSISKLCQVNDAALADNGEAVIATFTRKATVSELLDVQKAFKTAFTAEEPQEEPQKKSLVSFAKKAFKDLKNKLADNEGKEISVDDLKQYQFKNTEEIVFPYSTEEINTAREALLVLGKTPKKKDSAKKNKKSADKEKPAEETKSAEETKLEEPKEFMQELKDLIDERIDARKKNEKFSFKRVRDLFAKYQEDSDEDPVLNKAFLDKYNEDSDEDLDNDSIEQLKKWFEKLNFKVELDADESTDKEEPAVKAPSISGISAEALASATPAQKYALAIQNLTSQGWEPDQAKAAVKAVAEVFKASKAK